MVRLHDIRGLIQPIQLHDSINETSWWLTNVAFTLADKPRAHGRGAATIKALSAVS